MGKDPADVATAVTSGRDLWTNKVDQLRGEDKTAMELKNRTNYATMANGTEPTRSTCVSLFFQNQTEGGTIRAMRVRCVRKLVNRLKPLDTGYFDSPRPGRRTVYELTLKFATTGLAKLARDRILEEQNGHEWPPFAVVYAIPSIVRAMEVPPVVSTPGAAT
jgi:hypothetical protein